MADDIDIRVPLDADTITSDPAIQACFAHMEDCSDLRRLILQLRDAAIRGTHGMEPKLLEARLTIMKVAEAVLIKRLEYEFNLALLNLENHVLKKLTV